MRDIFKQAVVSAVLMSALALAEPLQPSTTPRPDSEPQQPNARHLEAQGRTLAEELLEGRQVVVRLFRDWHNKPAAFELVRAPIKTLALELDSLKLIVGQSKDSAFVLALGSDQTDEAVAAVLGDFVLARSYEEGQKLLLWPPRLDAGGLKLWSFVDAVGNPIPNASLGIRIRECSREAGVWLGKFNLDTNGCLKPIKPGDSATKLIFTVSHDDYGTAIIEADSSTKDATQTYVVPLVRMGSDAAGRAAQGFVTDSTGNPVPGAVIRWGNVQVPGQGVLEPYRVAGTCVITEADGWFAIYVPITEKGTLSRGLISPKAQYLLSIEPPKSLNLRSCEWQSFYAGVPATIVLTAMQTGDFFHTFAFEDMNDLITDPAELKKINLTLYRDGKQWMNLKYEDCQQGATLPTGTLIAETTLWEHSFRFEPIDLTPNSPERLVLRPEPPLIYRGTVVNGDTGEPMPGAFVMTGCVDHYTDPSSLSPQDWDRLRAAKTKWESNQGPSSRTLYEPVDRVTMTDANGRFELVFRPGLTPRLGAFTALAEGYIAKQTSSGLGEPNSDRVVNVHPTLQLFPVESIKPPLAMTLVFEDESGPVTDPNMLKKIRFRVENEPERSTSCFDYSERPPNLPVGTYHVTADWHGKYYIFEPVDLTEARPETVVFKPKEITEDRVIFRGRLVHGITGEPMAGALVINGDIDPSVDISALQAEDWAAIKTRGLELDGNDPAVIPLIEAFRYPQGGLSITRIKKIVRADATGWFQIAVDRATLEPQATISLKAIERDFLLAEQYLPCQGSPEQVPHGLPSEKDFERDQAGHVILPPIKLFPAGTIIIEPNIPDFGSGQDYQQNRIRFHWNASPDDTTPWLEDLWGGAKNSRGGRVSFKYELKPNAVQTAYIPADVELTIRVYSTYDPQRAPIVIPGVRLSQGQVLDLGRRDFPKSVRVAVRVVDSTGRPIKAVNISYKDEDRSFSHSGQRPVTNAEGVAWFYVPPNSKGEFFVPPLPNERLNEYPEESVPYQIAGPEDAGKQFTLTLSDEMLKRLSK